MQFVVSISNKNFMKSAASLPLLVLITLLISGCDVMKSEFAVSKKPKKVEAVTAATSTGINYNLIGYPETTFAGSNSFYMSNVSFEEARAVAVQSDGKVVVVGKISNADYDFMIYRLTADGVLDTTFNSGGAVPGFQMVDSPATGDDIAFAVDISSSGKIAVGGSNYLSGAGIFKSMLVVLNSNGTLDTSFGTGGIKVSSMRGADSDQSIYAVKYQSDGKLLVAGYVGSGSFLDVVLARFTTAGTLDPAFHGGTPLYITSSMAGNFAKSMTLDSATGDIYLGGHRLDSTGAYTENPIVAKVRSTGTLDGAFGVGGIMEYSLGGSHEQVYSVALNSDGLYFCGYSDVIAGNNHSFVAKASASSGVLDAGFGSSGYLHKAVSGIEDFCNQLILEDNGRVIALGSAYTDHTLYHYVNNDPLDHLFKNILELFAVPTAIAAAPPPGSFSYNFVAFALSKTGVLDTTFGDTGYFVQDMGTTFEDDLYGAARGIDGKVFGVGMCNTAFGPHSCTTKIK